MATDETHAMDNKSLLENWTKIENNKSSEDSDELEALSNTENGVLIEAMEDTDDTVELGLSDIIVLALTQLYEMEVSNQSCLSVFT